MRWGIRTVANYVAARTDPNIRKPALRLLPGGEVAEDAQAITNLLIFGNLLGRACPELVRQVMDLAPAAHARIAEQQLLTQVGALSTSVTGTTHVQGVSEAEGEGFGVTGVLLPLYERAAMGIRRLRMPADAALQLILPDWARGILRSDLAKQEPGDSTVGVTDAELNGYLATRHLAST